MTLQNTLEITILGARNEHRAFASGRLGNQVAFSCMPDVDAMERLFDIRDSLHNCVYGRSTMTAPQLDDVGRQLGGVLLADDIAPLYAAARSGGVRLALIINNCSLQSMPWEYLHGPADEPGPNRYRSVARIVSSGSPGTDDPPARPSELNVLLLVSANPTDVVPIDDLAGMMNRTFEAWLGVVNVQLTVRKVPTIKALSEAVNEGTRAWDVIHYIGHGDVRTVGGEELGGLELRGEGMPVFFSARRLCKLLQTRPPRLVILSACSTASAEFSFTFSNTAGSLARANIRAILANQMVITPDSVAGFCAAFYRTLLETGDIDAAVTSGRLDSYATLIPSSEEAARVEWGIPVLYRHIGAQRIYV